MNITKTTSDDIDFIAFQLTPTTAEEEQNYFYGESPPHWPKQNSCPIPDGIYRLVEGCLYRILNETAPLCSIKSLR